MNGRVVAIVVTYAKRHEYVEKVMHEVFHEGVSEVVLVDNASQLESRAVYDELVQSEKRIHLIRNDENLGSSGGFKAGLQYALSYLRPDFLWLLDDDNVPQRGSLKSLVDTWFMIATSHKVDDLALYSYRGETRAPDKRAVTHGHIKRYGKNNFMGFNFFKAFRRKFIKSACEAVNYPVVRVTFGPFGGAFFNFNVPRKVGLPSPEFFVYADDHEYSLRLNELGIQQYLVFASRLKDIDRSFDDDGLLSPNASDLKVYYSFRNHTYLSQRFITNRIFYYFNKFIYITFLLKNLMLLSFKYKGFAKNRAKLIIKAIVDGESSSLGKVDWLK